MLCACNVKETVNLKRNYFHSSFDLIRQRNSEELVRRRVGFYQCSVHCTGYLSSVRNNYYIITISGLENSQMTTSDFNFYENSILLFKYNGKS